MEYTVGAIYQVARQIATTFTASDSLSRPCIASQILGIRIILESAVCVGGQCLRDLRDRRATTSPLCQRSVSAGDVYVLYVNLRVASFPRR